MQHLQSQHAKENTRPKKWILLDKQSTIDVLYNKDLLKNIRKSDTEIKIHGNAGISTTNMVGDWPGYGTVWYHESGNANIFSLANFMKNHTVEFNSESGNNLRSREGRDWGRN